MDILGLDLSESGSGRLYTFIRVMYTYACIIGTREEGKSEVEKSGTDFSNYEMYNSTIPGQGDLNSFVMSKPLPNLDAIVAFKHMVRFRSLYVLRLGQIIGKTESGYKGREDRGG